MGGMLVAFGFGAGVDMGEGTHDGAVVFVLGCSFSMLCKQRRAFSLSFLFTYSWAAFLKSAIAPWESPCLRLTIARNW
jgi:hypothetical protein